MISLSKLTFRALQWLLDALMAENYRHTRFSAALLSVLAAEEARRTGRAVSKADGEFLVPFLPGDELTEAHRSLFGSVAMYHALSKTAGPNDRPDLESAADFCGAVLDTLGAIGRARHPAPRAEAVN
jgi:hypothetical protein